MDHTYADNYDRLFKINPCRSTVFVFLCIKQDSD